METPINHFVFDTYDNNEAMNIWQKSSIDLDISVISILYIQNYSITIKKKIDCCRIKLDNGKTIYPAYTFDEFRKMYYEFMIKLANSQPDPIAGN